MTLKKSLYNIEVPIGDEVLIFNTEHTGMVVLDNKEYDVYNNISSYSPNNTHYAKEVSALTDDGFLVDFEDEEYEIIKRISWNYRNSSDIVKIVIAPTSNCNFRCSYCYETGIYHHTMNTNTADEIYKKICDHLDSTMPSNLVLIWYGGEPLLAIDIIIYLSKKIIEYCENKNIRFISSMTTNGYLLSEEYATLLKDSGCLDVQITIDGDKESHDKRRILHNGNGSFDRIIDNINKIYKILNLSIRVNIDKKNFNGIKPLIDRLVDIGLTEAVIKFSRIENCGGYFDNTSFNAEEFSIIEVDLIRYALSKGMKNCIGLPKPMYGFCEPSMKYSLELDPEGNEFLCWEQLGRINNPNSFIESSRYLKETHHWEKESCKTCSIYPICLAGCPQRCLELGEPQCNPLKYNIKELLKLYYEQQIQE